MIGGNMLTIEYANMADNFGLEESENSPDTQRGRKSAVEDGRLWADRDHFVWLLETSWPDLGGRLSTVKSPSDVLALLQIWKERSQNYGVQILLRAKSKPATTNSLNAMRRRIRELNVARLKASDYMQTCRESLEVAQRASNGQLSEREKVMVEQETKCRADKFAQAEKEYEALNRQHAEMEQALQDGEAYFARAEFVGFCRSQRYRLTAVNTANALAGLPLMGWRQSAKRCKAREPSGSNGGAMQIFDAIRRIVQSCTRKSELIKHAECWLKRPVGISSKSYGVSELRKDWFYLRWSIKTVLEAGSRTRDLPYAIAREYWDRKAKATNVDRLLEEGERIVV
jgi:hypothetical protein